MSTDKPDKVALTPAEFAALFGKSQTWAYRQLYAGKVEAVSGYGRVLIPVTEVDKILKTSGRYLGAQATPEKPKASQKPVSESNPWRSSIRNRRKTPGNNPNRSKKDAARYRAQRSAVLRKLRNRS